MPPPNENHRGRVRHLIIENLLEGRQAATRSHHAAEVGRRKEFRRGEVDLGTTGNTTRDR